MHGSTSHVADESLRVIEPAPIRKYIGTRSTTSTAGWSGPRFFVLPYYFPRKGSLRICRGYRWLALASIILVRSHLVIALSNSYSWLRGKPIYLLLVSFRSDQILLSSLITQVCNYSVRQVRPADERCNRQRHCCLLLRPFLQQLFARLVYQAKFTSTFRVKGRARLMFISRVQWILLNLIWCSINRDNGLIMVGFMSKFCPHRVNQIEWARNKERSLARRSWSAWVRTRLGRDLSAAPCLPWAPPCFGFCAVQSALALEIFTTATLCSELVYHNATRVKVRECTHDI